MKISRKEQQMLVATMFLCAGFGGFSLLAQYNLPKQPLADVVANNELDGAQHLQRLVIRNPQQKRFVVVWMDTSNGDKGWSVLTFNAGKNTLFYKPFHHWPEDWHFEWSIPPFRKYYRHFPVFKDTYGCNKVTANQITKSRYISVGTLLKEAGCDSGHLTIT